MKFDTTLYPQLAVVTESADYPAIRARIKNKAPEILEAFAEFIVAAEKLDKLKKTIFYGKGFVESHTAVSEEEFNGIVNAFASDGLIRIGHAILGIATESGEFVEGLRDLILGNVSYQDFMVNLGEESGDVDWYQALLNDAAGLTEEDVRNRNNNKLIVKRYGTKFTAERAVERDISEELKTLANPQKAIPEQVVGFNWNEEDGVPSTFIRDNYLNCVSRVIPYGTTVAMIIPFGGENEAPEEVMNMRPTFVDMVEVEDSDAECNIISPMVVVNGELTVRYSNVEENSSQSDCDCDPADCDDCKEK